MFSGSISEDVFVSYIKLAQLKLSIRNSSTEQEAKVAHPVSPLARLIHPLLLDLSEAESNNELWPQYYFTKEERRLICTAVLKSTKCTESLQTIWINKTHWQMSWNTFPTTYSVTVVMVFATYSIVQLYPRQQRIKLVWERWGLSQTMFFFFGDLHLYTEQLWHFFLSWKHFVNKDGSARQHQNRRVRLEATHHRVLLQEWEGREKCPLENLVLI